MAGSAMISVRMPDETREQLEATAHEHGESRSALMQRYIEEGLRMDRHPGIVFRGGPAGRRPGLAGGPDLWEVIRVVNNAGTRGEGAIAEAATWLALPAAHVRIAVNYYADHRVEIDAWLEMIDAKAAAADEAFQRRAEVLR